MPKPQTVVMTAEHLRLMLRDERNRTLSDVEAVIAREAPKWGTPGTLIAAELIRKLAPLIEPAGADANARGGGE